MCTSCSFSNIAVPNKPGNQLNLQAHLLFALAVSLAPLTFTKIYIPPGICWAKLGH